MCYRKQGDVFNITNGDVRPMLSVKKGKKKILDVRQAWMNKTGNVHTNATLRRICLLFPCKSEKCYHPEGAPVAVVILHAKHKIRNTFRPAMNGTIFGKYLLNIKCVFWFYLQLLSEKFLVLRRTERHIIINVHNGKCPFFL